MQLYAALVPPPQVRRDLVALVRGVRLPAPGGPPGRHRGETGRLASLVRRRAVADEASGPSTEGMLDVVEAGDQRVHLASFGNVGQQDVGRLTALLTEAAQDWPTLRLRTAGGVMLDWPGDDGVWARLDGDVEVLGEIAREVPQVAQRLQLFIDRRRFRPLVPLGTITDDTTVPYLERLLVDLEAHETPWWEQTSLPLLQLSAGADTGLRTVAEIPLRG